MSEILTDIYHLTKYKNDMKIDQSVYESFSSLLFVEGPE